MKSQIDHQKKNYLSLPIMQNNLYLGSSLGQGSLLTHSTPNAHIDALCVSGNTYVHDLTICAYCQKLFWMEGYDDGLTI